MEFLWENGRWNKRCCEIFKETMKESSIVFVNTDELLEFPRLLSRKIVFVGGIAVPKASTLTEVCNAIVCHRMNHANYTKSNISSRITNNLWTILNVALS